MKTELCEFIEHNVGPCDNPQTLWEAAKSFIRGTCIGFASRLKAEHNKWFSENEKEIVNTNILNVLRGEYRSLSISEAEFILHRTKQRYYYDGDHPRRLLALNLKQN